MPLPIGSVIEVTFVMRQWDQRTLNVLHYRVTGASSIADPVAEEDDIISAIKAGGAASLFTAHRNMTPESVFYDAIRVQAITPVRYVARSSIETSQGVLGPSNATNLAFVIEKRTNLSGRMFRGSLHVPAGDPDTFVQGVVTAAMDLRLTDFGTKMLLNLTGPVGGGVYVPVIYHKPPLAIEPTTITGFDTKDTVRVMRRRTVRVGE